MSGTYKATGINLKSMPMGESDRLLTILTREYGLIRAVAVGARKHNSKMGGRSGLFVVNELLIAKGRSLDKVTQAETLESYPGLGQDLKKLTASQYLAELVLCQALSEQPQEELFSLLNEHLKRLEQADKPSASKPEAAHLLSPSTQVLAHLTHAVFQLLVLAGVAPQVHTCCVTRQPLSPDFTNPDWRIGFSIPSGGTVTFAAFERLKAERLPPPKKRNRNPSAENTTVQTGISQTSRSQVAEARGNYHAQAWANSSRLNLLITAAQLDILQQLAQVELPVMQDLRYLPTHASSLPAPEDHWLSTEQILRQYAQYHFDRPIRSATLIDACFSSDATQFKR